MFLGFFKQHCSDREVLRKITFKVTAGLLIFAAAVLLACYFSAGKEPAAGRDAEADAGRTFSVGENAGVDGKNAPSLIEYETPAHTAE